MENTNTNANEQAWRLLVVLLQLTAAEKGIKQEQLAERTGYTQSNISRVFSLRYCPKLSVFINLANAIGVNFFFEDRENLDIDYNRLVEEAMDKLGRRPDKLPKN